MFLKGHTPLQVLHLCCSNIKCSRPTIASMCMVVVDDHNTTGSKKVYTCLIMSQRAYETQTSLQSFRIRFRKTTPLTNKWLQAHYIMATIIFKS